jgi:hypothetical protein
MRSVRFSIAWLMTVVLILALGLAALRNPTELWAGAVPLATEAMFCLAIVGAVCRTGRERVWWLGVAVFGWSYLRSWGVLYLWMRSPMHRMLEALGPIMGVPMGAANSGNWNVQAQSFMQIGHNLWALIFALLGGFLARAIFGAAAARSAETVSGSPAPGEVPRGSWVLPCMIMLSGLVLVTSVSLACARLEPGLWVGLTYLMTWWLIGLTALGALFGRGRRREFWMGATFFGAGFLFLVFNRHPYDEHNPQSFLPTVQFLEALRPRLGNILSRFYADDQSTAVRNARILTTLERRVPMPFPQATPLEDVLKYIQDATRGPDGKTIPIYVDPIGLAESEKTLRSDLMGIDLEDVELRTSLRLLLEPIDLDYTVRDGLLLITSRESMGVLLQDTDKDPLQIAGHCLIAVIAAVLGGLAAPLVCDLARKRDRSRGGTGTG